MKVQNVARGRIDLPAYSHLAGARRRLSGHELRGIHVPVAGRQRADRQSLGPRWLGGVNLPALVRVYG